MRRAILLMAMMALTLLVASGVALAVTKIGTDGPDTLRGTNGADTLIGKGGNDILIALRGQDTLLGGEGKDALWGGTLRDSSVGEKNLVGGPGNDLVLGGKSSDNLLGGAGNDFMVDGEYRNPVIDNLSSGSGNDVLNVITIPAGKDIVSCGSGFDRVLADRKDVLAPDCEKVRVVHGSLDEIAEQEQSWAESIPQSFYEGLPRI